VYNVYQYNTENICTVCEWRHKDIFMSVYITNYVNIAALIAERIDRTTLLP